MMLRDIRRLGVLVAVMVLAGTTVSSATTLQMVDLGLLPGGAWSEATAINIHDVVVGEAETADSFHAVRWDRRGITDLGTLPGGTASETVAINADGVVAGHSFTLAAGRHRSLAVYWNPRGDVTRLELLPGATESFVVALNNAGVSVGRVVLANGLMRAVRWDRHGGVTDLGVLPGTEESDPAGINATGAVAGYSWTFSDGLPMTRAVRWNRDAGISELEVPDDVRSFAADISDRGTVVGGDVMGHGWRWDRLGVRTELESLGGGGSAPIAINRNETVIGNAVATDMNSHGVRWDRHGRITDLQLLPETNASSAVAINDHDVVVGWSISPLYQSSAAYWDRHGRITQLGGDSRAVAINNKGTIIGVARLGASLHAVVWYGNRA